MMLSSRPSPVLNGDNTTTTTTRPKRRRSSALGIFLRRHNSHKSSVADITNLVTKLHNVDNLPIDDTCTSSISSLASTNSLVPEVAGPTNNATNIKSCLKYKTQIASLQHVFAHSNKKDQEPNQETSPSVQFGSIEIHSHGMILGDHPAVTSGPPVTIEWTSFDTCLVNDVDGWEASRVAVPRKGQELLLPKRLREDVIQRSGRSTPREVAAAVRATGRIRARRQRTAHRSLMNDQWRKRFSRAARRGGENNE